MLVIAHRGASAFAPENTLEAMQKAIACGADGVEFDVQLSSDGVPLVIHDDYLSRTTNGEDIYPARRPWSTAEFTFKELLELDAGSWFVSQLEAAQSQAITHDERKSWISAKDIEHYRSGNVRIPTLRQCLRLLCQENKLEAHVELKSVPRRWPDLAARVVAEIEELGVEELCTLSSFDHHALVEVKRLNPEIKTAVLSADRMYQPHKYLEFVGAVAYNPGCYGEYDTMGFGSVEKTLDTQTVSSLLENNFKVFVWTTNDPEQMLELRDAGVSGIFTDFPNRARELFGFS